MRHAIITVGLGYDDWEWGVTLWARNPELLKDIVYRMRFDEASARYAEFGPFYVSYVMSPTEVGAYASGDARSRILTNLGLVIPAEIDELAGDQFYSQFSLEELKRLDRDVLVWITYEPDIVEQIKASPLRSQMTAVAEGREVFLTEMEAGAASFSSVLSLPYFLETFVPLTFVGNHDVTRLASAITDPRHHGHAVAILGFVGGVLGTALGLGLAGVVGAIVNDYLHSQGLVGVAPKLPLAVAVQGVVGAAVLSTLAADKTAGVLGDLGHRPNPAERADALLEGFQVAFTAAAILVAFGGLLLLLAVRKSDVAGIDPDAMPAPAA